MPTLLTVLKALPWNRVRAGSTSTQHGHGRRARCTINVINVPTVPGWLQFTGAARIAQLRRAVTKGGMKTVEVVYLITSADRCTALPATLAAWVQRHWMIDNTLHWVRDVTYDGDRPRHAAHVMATLRSAAISILRFTGWDKIATDRRHHSRNPERATTCALTC